MCDSIGSAAFMKIYQLVQKLLDVGGSRLILTYKHCDTVSLPFLI